MTILTADVNGDAGMIYSRPEALYFWVYFVFVNSIWIVIPSWNIWTVTKQINLGVAATDR